MKKCTKCGEEKPATLEYFYHHSHGKLRNDCKKCTYKKNNTWRKNTPKARAGESSRRYWRNPEKHRVRSKLKENRRRANKLGNGCEKYSESEVLKTYGTNCYLCDMPINLNAPRRPGVPGWRSGLQIEHFVAIAQGGSDTLENVRPSHGWCNLAKGTK